MKVWEYSNDKNESMGNGTGKYFLHSKSKAINPEITQAVRLGSLEKVLGVIG